MGSKSRSIRRSTLKKQGKLPDGKNLRIRENPLKADRYYPSIGKVKPTNPARSQ
jgi:hypothetical protein